MYGVVLSFYIWSATSRIESVIVRLTYLKARVYNHNYYHNKRHPCLLLFQV